VLAKIRCWVALQAPFYGSPLADTADAPVVGTVGAFLLTLASGDGNSLADLRTDLRADYMSRHSIAIAATVTRIRPLCVTSYFDRSDPRFPHPPQLIAARYIMERRGLRNDSLSADGPGHSPGLPLHRAPEHRPHRHDLGTSDRPVAPRPRPPDPGLVRDRPRRIDPAFPDRCQGCRAGNARRV
jgi:hypothetical protein